MGQPPVGQDPIKANQSILNPMDAAKMKQGGGISMEMPYEDFVEQVLGVPKGAPVSQFLEGLKNQSKNATGMGKMQSMGGQPSQAPPSAPPMGAAPAPSGLDGLMT